jgi:alkenylglycerophosphocholine/alkenylglycerophosphoethanolamine hydrolase
MTSGWKGAATGVLSVLGLAAAIAYVVGLAVDAPGVRFAVKGIPVLCLLAWVLMAGNLPRRVLIAGGLAWSVVGDVLLAMIDLGADKNLLFGAGLGAFLIAHLFYIGFFASRGRGLMPLRVLPFLAWGVVVFVLVQGKLGPLMIPVAVYILVIVTMMWRAFCLTDGDGRTLSLAQTAAWGALLFGISDTLIALNKFWMPIPGAAYAIIVTYWVGQLGIARASRG